MKKVAVFLIPLVLAAAAILMLARRSSPDRPALPDVSNETLADEVARLRADVARLKMQTPPAAAAPAAAPAAAAAPAPVSAAEREARTRANRERWYATLDTQLAGESADPAWSADMSRQLQTMVGKRAAVATMTSARCASTLCRVVVSHADRISQRSFVGEIAGERLLESEVVYKYDREGVPPTTTFWVARKGHKLPRAAREDGGG
jgi:hypothetical protein